MPKIPKKLLIVPAFILTLALVFFVYVQQFSGLNNQMNNGGDSELFDSDKGCKADSDCVIVAKQFGDEKCCFGCSKDVFNNKTAIARDEWRKQNCNEDYYMICPVLKCKAERPAVPKCVNNLCEIEWKDKD